MSRTNPAALFVALAAAIAAIGAVSLLRGEFLVGIHEGDLIHLLDIVFRMEQGQVPHVDFETPIGALSFLPIVVFLDSGFGIGNAIIWSQIAVAIVLLPALWWAAWTRLPGSWGYTFGVILCLLVLALIYGDASKTTAFSLHYNRWAWAMAFIAILVAIRPPIGSAAESVDGIVVGVIMGALALMKITYFVALAPGILVGLLVRRAWVTIGYAAGGGLAVALAVTVLYGIGFWFAYLDNLFSVVGSEIRPYPGDTLIEVISAPKHLANSLILLAAVLLLRHAGRASEGAALLFLMPGFWYITFQNWGNDPQWMIFLAILLLAETSRGEGSGEPDAAREKQGHGFEVLGAMAFIVATPGLLNMVNSTIQHNRIDASEYTALLPAPDLHDDLLIRTERAYGYIERTFPDPPPAPPGMIPEDLEIVETSVFRGTEFRDCENSLAVTLFNASVAMEIERLGLSDAGIFIADGFSSAWLFGAHGPLPGGTPWYYSGLPGFENADYFLVPHCPSVLDARREILRLADERPETFDLVEATDHLTIYRIGRQAPQ